MGVLTVLGSVLQPSTSPRSSPLLVRSSVHEIRLRDLSSSFFSKDDSQNCRFYSSKLLKSVCGSKKKYQISNDDRQMNLIETIQKSLVLIKDLQTKYFAATMCLLAASSRPGFVGVQSTYVCSVFFTHRVFQ